MPSADKSEQKIGGEGLHVHSPPIYCANVNPAADGHVEGLERKASEERAVLT
jgi:hypothetical protein